MAFLFGVLANTLWATSFLASKYTLETWGPFSSSFFRFILASILMICLYPFIGLELKFPNKKEWAPILLVALFQFGLLYPLQLYGLEYLDTSVSAAIMLISPLFVISLAGMLLSEVITIQKVLAILIGIIGGLVLFGEHIFQNNSYTKGLLLTFSAALCLAISIVLTRKYGKKIETSHLTLWSMIIGSFLLFPFFLSEPQTKDGLVFSWSNHKQSITALFYLSIVCSAFTFYIWNKALKMTEAKNLASTMHLKTPVAIIIGVIIAKEELSTSIILGTIIIFLGVWFSQAKINNSILLKKIKGRN